MTNERYAAGDDAFKAVIDHAPNKESTNLPGVVANAGAREPEIVTTAGQLPEVVPNPAASLKPENRQPEAEGRGANPGRRDRRVWPNGAADAEPAGPRAMPGRPLT